MPDIFQALVSLFCIFTRRSQIYIDRLGIAGFMPVTGPSIPASEAAARSRARLGRDRSFMPPTREGVEMEEYLLYYPS
jgi:hypothetical protein